MERKIKRIISGEKYLYPNQELFNYMNVEVDYLDSGKVVGNQMVTMTPEEYKKELFKEQLVSQGYALYDLERFEDLVNNYVRKERDIQDSCN